MKTRYLILSTILFLSFSYIGYSQQLFLKITTKDSLNFPFLKSIILTKEKMNKQKIQIEKKSIQKQLFRLGYLNFEILSEIEKDSIYTINYKLNAQIKSIHVNLNENKFDDDFIFANTIENNKIKIRFIDTESFLRKLTKFYEEKGYPFVKISLSNYKVNEISMTADLNITKDIPRKIDKIVIKGYDKFPKRYLSSILKTSHENSFSKRHLESITSKLNTIPFISVIKKPQVLFLKDSTLIYIYLKKKKINQFDGIVGFSTNKNSNIEFNGYLDLSLNNIFNKGEQIDLQWKSTEEQNKQLTLDLKTPYIFNTNLSPNINFSIFSQDSSYIKINSKNILHYHLNYKNKIGLIFQYEKSTNLLEITNINIQNYNSTLYGVNYNYTKRTSMIFYKKKIGIDFNIMFGNSNQNVKKYDKSKFDLKFNYLFQVNTKNLIEVRNNSSFTFLDKYLINEFDRIGGRGNIRGFKENSIPVSKYSVFNFEYNYLINKETSIYSITDYAYTINDVAKIKNSFYSFGLGYKTKLKSSILNFSYVVGKTNNQVINFNNSIVNIEFLSFF